MDFCLFRTSRIIMSQQSTMITGLFLSCFAMRSWQERELDPELTSDFVVPGGIIDSTPNAGNSTALRNDSAKARNFARVSQTDLGSFPARQGVGVSSALLQDLLVLVTLVEGINRFFTQTLEAGGSFVFPKESVHFQIYWRKDHKRATAMTRYSTSICGLLCLSSTLLKSEIPNRLLAKALRVSCSLMKQLKAASVSSCRQALFRVGLWNPCTLVRVLGI